MKLLKMIIAVCAMIAGLTCNAGDVDSTFYLNGQMGRLNVHLQLPDRKKGIVAGMVAPELGVDNIKSAVLIASGGVAPDLMLMGNFFGIIFDPWNLPEYLTLPDGKKLGRNYLQTMRDLPIYQTAAKYTGPTLVLNGRKDTIVPYNYAIRYAEVMPGAELHIIENENHGFTVTSDETAAMIARWLKEQDSK